MRKRRSPRNAIAIGETWFVKFPGASACTCVEIDELTGRTVALRPVDDLGVRGSQFASRYVRSEIKFIERVPR